MTTPLPRPGPREILAETRAAEVAITRRLRDIALVDVDRGLSPSPYLRRHLVDHALAGGVLDPVHVPNALLPHLDLTALQGALSHHAAGGASLPMLPVLRQIAHRWRYDEPEFNAGLLEMWAALASMPIIPSISSWWQVRWAVSPSDRSTIVGLHGGDVWAVATWDSDVDQPLAVSAAGDGQVRVWNLRTGARERLWNEHVRPVIGVAVVRTSDGRLLVISASEDGSVRTWDAAADGPLAATPIDLARPLTAFRIMPTPTGFEAVTGDAYGQLRRWPIDRRGTVGAPVTIGVQPTAITALAIMDLPEGNIGVAGGQDGTLCAWDLAAGAVRGTVIEAHAGGATGLTPVRAVTVVELRNGARIAVSGGEDGTFRRWSLDGRGELVMLGDPIRPGGRVRALVGGRLADNTAVIAVGFGRRLGLWDAETGVLIGEPQTGPEGSVTAVSMTRTGGRVAAITGDRGDSVRRWELDNTSLTGAGGGARAGLVEALAVASIRDDTSLVITAAEDGGLHVWDAATGEESGSALLGNASGVLAMAAITLAGGRPVVLAAGFDGRIHDWDLDTRVALHDPWPGHAAPLVGMLAVRVEGRAAVVTAGWDGTLRVWDVATAAAMRPIMSLQTRDVRALALATLADGSTVAVTGGADGLVERWDIERARSLGPPITLGEAAITQIATTFAGTQPVVVAGDDNGFIAVHDLVGGEQLWPSWSARVVGGVVALQVFHTRPERQLLAVAGEDPLVHVRTLRGGVVGQPLPTVGPVQVLAAYPQAPASLLVAGAGVAAVAFRDADDVAGP